MNWLQKILPSIVTGGDRKGVPEGIWTQCTGCETSLYTQELTRQLFVCHKCGHHMPMSARRRLESFLDPESFTEIGADVKPRDMLKFKDSKRYKDRLSSAQKQTGEHDALVVASGRLQGMPIVAASFDFKFIGGSMGYAVGERFVQGVDAALASHSPFVCFTASGGARMQEGLVSLMQMAKTSAALAKLAEARLPFISILAHPTMGGVSASLAMLGDVIMAEPKALIGFAGPRVIEQTVREILPEGFQRSEFLLEHGAIDMIVDRRDMRARVFSVLSKLTHHNG